MGCTKLSAPKTFKLMLHFLAQLEVIDHQNGSTCSCTASHGPLSWVWSEPVVAAYSMWPLHLMAARPVFCPPWTSWWRLLSHWEVDVEKSNDSQERSHPGKTSVISSCGIFPACTFARGSLNSGNRWEMQKLGSWTIGNPIPTDLPSPDLCDPLLLEEDFWSLASEQDSIVQELLLKFCGQRYAALCPGLVPSRFNVNERKDGLKETSLAWFSCSNDVLLLVPLSLPKRQGESSFDKGGLNGYIWNKGIYWSKLDISHPTMKIYQVVIWSSLEKVRTPLLWT